MVRMVGLICVHGTWGRQDEWPARLRRVAEAYGYEIYSYRWSGRIDGLFGRDDTWESAADGLRHFRGTLTAHLDCDVIAHSHGGQVAIRAIAEGMEARNLITIATPVRPSMSGMRQRCADLLTHEWLHLHGDWWRDWMARLGRIGPSWMPQISLQMPEADNVWLRGHGHSSMLTPELLAIALDRVQE